VTSANGWLSSIVSSIQVQYFRKRAGVSLLALRWEMQVSTHARSAAVSFAAYEGDDKMTAPSVTSAAAILNECNIRPVQRFVGWVERTHPLKLNE
jgi:hypothetical protein